MQTFKQHIQTLEEGRDAPLFHGVQIPEDLLISRVIKPLTEHERKFLGGVRRGISLTRSYNFAKLWSRKQCVIELNQTKLAQNFQMVPLQYWTGGARAQAQPFDNSTSYMVQPYHLGSEFEEFLITDKPIPIEKYATRVYASVEIFQRLFNEVNHRPPVDITECMSFCHKYLGVPVGPIK